MLEVWLLPLLVLVVGPLHAFCTLMEDFVVSSNRLQITVDEYSAYALGSIDIDLLCLKATSQITLDWGSSLEPPYGDNFTILRGMGSSPTVAVDVVQVVQDSMKADVTITTQSSDTPSFSKQDTITLTIRFRTAINSEQKGIFRRQYSSTGGKWFMLATFLYPSYARDLFPCVDEPSMPVSFNLDITIPVGWTVTTSLHLDASSTNESTKMSTRKYSSNSKLPTYSLAIFISNGMRAIDYKIFPRTTITFWVPKDSTDADYEYTFKFLADYFHKMESILDTNYSLTDTFNIVMVPGLPSPFAGYGVVFIRNTIYSSSDSSCNSSALLYEELMPVFSQFLRQFTEFSTRPASWADLWLSSAMTTYLQYAILNAINPDYDLKTELDVVVRQSALALDGTNSKPLEDHSIDGASPSNVEASTLDTLKILKGASLFSMLDVSFPAGSLYSTILTILQNNKDKSMTSTSFYQQFSATVTNGPYYVSDDMKISLDNLPSWFNSSGYQVIYVRNDENNSVSMEVVPFCGLSACADAVTLNVPVTVSSMTEPRYYCPRQDLWVRSNTTTVARLMIQKRDWVVANMHSGGFFRTQYSTANWERLVAATNHDQPAKWSHLLDDAFALSAEGQLDYNITLRLAVSNIRTRPYRDWYPVHKGLAKLHDSLWDTDIYPSYQNFLLPLLEHVNAQVENGWFSNVCDGQKVFSLFLEDICRYDIGNVRSTATTFLHGALQGSPPSTNPYSYSDPLVCCGAQFTKNVSGQTLWETIKDTSASYNQRHFSSVALGCLHQDNLPAWQLKTFLVNDTDIEKRNPYLVTALKFLAKKQPLVLLTLVSECPERFQNLLGTAVLASVISTAGQMINNESQATMLTKIGSGLAEYGVVKDAVTGVVEGISARAKWLRSFNTSLTLALEANRLNNVTNSTSGAETLFPSSSAALLLAPLAVFLNNYN